MMTTVAPIVEGHGEVEALPLLLRRLAEWQTPNLYASILPPIRVRKDRFLNNEREFQRHLVLAADKCGEQGWILLLLDADDDCPATRGAEVLQRAQSYIPYRRISVVFANREYEAWFVAAAQSLHGYRGFSLSPGYTVDAETIRNAKGWVERQMGGVSYSEVLHQPGFSQRFDMQQAFDGSRSFRKLCSEWLKQAWFEGAGDLAE